MTKQKIKIFITAMLSLIIVFELGYIVKRLANGESMTVSSNSDGASETVSVSQNIYKINMQTIPAYTISNNDGAYLVDTDLELFGFNCTRNGNTYELTNPEKSYTMTSDAFMQNVDGTSAEKTDQRLVVGDQKLQCYKTSGNALLIPAEALKSFGIEQTEASVNTVYYALGDDDTVKNVITSISKEINGISYSSSSDTAAATPLPTTSSSGTVISMDGSGTTYNSGAAASSGRVIVLDPGHGKSSSDMTAEEKKSSGWVQNSSGSWGEWRHYKTGSSTVDCEGEGCNGRVTPSGACWYPIGNGDRDTEPEVNLQNALAAKKYLEQMGYTVRMTRTSNSENPSITKRCSYNYPNNDTSKTADSLCMVVIHSNAGGGSGTSYISLEGEYDQRGISSTYVSDSNKLGKLCNDKVAEATELSNNGAITFEPQLISFMKSPVPCGYLEIGYFDSSSDLDILESEYDAIGKAIAEGIDEFVKGIG